MFAFTLFSSFSTLTDSQQLKIYFKQVLRQAQHERNINTLRQQPFALSLSKGSCCKGINLDGFLKSHHSAETRNQDKS